MSECAVSDRIGCEIGAMEGGIFTKFIERLFKTEKTWYNEEEAISE